MVRKKISIGLILLLLLALGGCRAGGVDKDVVFSQELKATDGIKNASYTVSIQQNEAVEKAEAAFRQYLNIPTIDKSLVLKAVLIEDDGVMWMNPYWKLSWLGKDVKKPVCSAKIDAQTGQVVQLRYRPNWGHKVIYKEDVLAYQKKALAYIDKFALVKEAPLSIFEASSSLMEGISVEFRYGTDKFIMLYFNEAGDVAGFEFSQQVAYTLQGNDLKIDRGEAIEIARASIKQYYGKADTSGLIEQVRLFEGKKGDKIWFVSWKNIAPLEGRFTRYGAEIDALSGKIRSIEGVNEALDTMDTELSQEKQREIADRFLEQKNMADYRFETFIKDTGTLRYRDDTGSPLNVFVGRSGNVDMLFFFELK